MKIVCDNCATKYSIADEKVRGKVFKIKCKKCTHIIVVKGQEGAPDGPPAGFDQKETRVFDYSGFDAGKEGGGEAVAGDAVWHLVINSEQVGPLTVAEIQAKVASGEVDAETYAWRDGFGDWQRLGSIDELAGVAPGIAPAAAPETGADGDAAGLFAGTDAAGAAEPSARAADPADLFGAPAPAAENPSDLFGAPSRPAAEAPTADAGVFASTAGTPTTAPAQRAPSGNELFAATDAPTSAAPSTGSGKMTGQRNENSVLFSLSNLASLATDNPQAAKPASAGAGTPGYASSGGSEGSGLIDIRAMAAMTIGNKKDEGPRTSVEDDLPVFSASSFTAPAAGVLLPTVQPAERNNKLVYVFMGVVGLLAIAAIILVAVILLDDKEPTQVAEVAPGAAGATGSTPTPPVSASAPGTTGTATAPTPSRPTEPTEGARPSAQAPAEAPPPTRGGTTDRSASRKDDRRAAADTRRPAATPPPPAAEPPPAKPASSQKCDEVACLVTPDLPCCPKRGGSAGGGSRASSDSGGGNLPNRLEQRDIIAGMRTVSGRVMGCNDGSVKGTFKVKVTVAADGSVTNASAGAPLSGKSAESCVERAVRGARFKRTKNSITFNYPYTFN